MSIAQKEQAVDYADLEVFTRHPKNPILSRQDWSYPINSVFNAGAVLLAQAYLTSVLLARKTGLMDGE
jgi:hypothetical protein